MVGLQQMLEGALNFLWFSFTYIWLAIDHLLTVRRMNKKSLQQIRSDERDMKGKVVIVTGSNSGIGKGTALELARREAKVIMACRDPFKAEAAKQDILNVVPNAHVELISIDMSDMESIRKFVDEFKLRYDHLDVLVNNAGIISPNFTFTKDGFEKHIGVNYLGSFLLTLLLLDSLKKAESGRIVFLSSSALFLAILNMDNIMMKDQQLGIWTPYANSKLCLAIFSRQLAKLLMATRVTTYAVCTGPVQTNIFREKGGILYNMVVNGFYLFGFFSIQEVGCATVLHCVLSKSLERETGEFYRYLTIWKPVKRMIAKYNATALWNLSAKLVGLESYHLGSLGEVSSK